MRRSSRVWLSCALLFGVLIGLTPERTIAKPRVQTAKIEITTKGYQPTSLKLRRGVRARVTFLRTTEATCVKEIVLPDFNVRRALRQKLLLLGLSSQRIASLNSTSQISSEVNVPAPSSGTLTSRSVNTGEVIEANKELMRVTDLSTVWLVGQVYEKDLATVRVGSGANITSDAYPRRVFRGRVSYVDPKVDPATRRPKCALGWPTPDKCSRLACMST